MFKNATASASSPVQVLIPTSLLIVTVGAEDEVYPVPALFIVNAVIVPPALTVAVAIAVIPLVGADIVTVGTPVYPTPGLVMVNAFITVDPEESVAVAVAREDGGVNVQDVILIMNIILEG